MVIDASLPRTQKCSGRMNVVTEKYWICWAMEVLQAELLVLDRKMEKT